MAVNIAQTLQGTVVQGGADAFVQSSIVTALAGQSRQAYRVLGLHVEIDRFFMAAGANIEVAFTRRTKAAMPLISDVDVVHKFKWGMEFTTSGGFNQYAIGDWIPAGDVIIVEDPLYVQLDSNATTGTHTVAWQLEYEIITLSEVDRLNLLARSLT
jgi:hypothetical protein